MDDLLQFASRKEFRAWLTENSRSSGGVWLLFGKAGGPKTLKAGEALEEALCFGWIDGQMQSMGETAYKKYFPCAGQKASGPKRTRPWSRSWRRRG